MNEQVLTWGASSTSFIEPTGLAPANVSSPYDYAIISREILKQPLIQKISTTANYNFSTINTKQAHYLKNTNPWVGQNLYNLSGTKTGYLHESLYCLMNKVKTKSGLELIAVNFGSPSRATSFSDNEQLIQYGTRLLSQ
jgi:D-alanyl-D-alanine carboxypeptidase